MRAVVGIVAGGVFCVAVAATSGSAAESPLRGGVLSKHLSGPEFKAEDAIGKVVFLEYWGYN